MVRYIMHSDAKKTKSKYKGGFVNGKNTKEYNHNYYLANKSRWKIKYGIKSRESGIKPITSELDDDYVTTEIHDRNKENSEKLRKILEVKFKDVPKKKREKLIEEMVSGEEERREKKLAAFNRKRSLSKRSARAYKSVINR